LIGIRVVVVTFEDWLGHAPMAIGVGSPGWANDRLSEGDVQIDKGLYEIFLNP